MGKHFLSVLGTGLYEYTNYYCDEGNYETDYVQQALLKLKVGQIGPEDRISIFLTSDSRERNWENRSYTEWEINNAKAKGKCLPEMKEGLGSVLTREYGACVDRAEDCLIPIGANEDELWEIFQVIFSRIGEDEELYIDITHSLRNIPVQMLAVIAYARVIKNVQVKGIYYGAFEVGKRMENGMKEAPIMDLITFLELLDWSQAANTFVKYGNSEQIYDLYHEQKQRTKIKQSELHLVVKEIRNLTHGLEMSQGCYCPDKNKRTGALNAYKRYKDAYDSMKRKDNSGAAKKSRQRDFIKPLGELLDVVDKRVRVFDVETNFDMGMAAVQWAIDNKNTQQGFTALEETVKTFLCNYYGLDELNYNNREQISKDICRKIFYACKGKDNDQLSREKREELYREWYLDKQEKKTDKDFTKELPVIHEIFLTLPVDLAMLVQETGNRRNNMNHFGFSNIGINSEKYEKDLQKYFNEFQEIIERMKGLREENNK